MRTPTLPILAFAAVLSGCASAAPADPSRGTTITSEQIVATNSRTAWEVVQKLEPQWLTSRGSRSLTDATPAVPSVFLNGVQVGDIEYLKNINAATVTSMRYYEPGEASARFGMGHPRGVIDVRTG